MANPSTTGGTGAGTEVLRRAYKATLANTAHKLIDGVADHIYTVTSIIVTNIANTARLINMYAVIVEDSNTELYLLREMSLDGYATFVWDDKIVLTGTDELHIHSVSGADVDVLITYIDQTF